MGTKHAIVAERTVSRCVILLQRFLDRFHEKPRQRIVAVEILAGKSENVVTELRLPVSTTVGELRIAVGRHFGEVSCLWGTCGVV